ncbi:hypothetical protein CBR_g47937 [Chara braunii]|uniref:PPPDE domain-containing protein n=1 Tax=Chara braunii TaxID=69332 RepID=A0A388M1K4_CHABU|nr:hypothetical protein CBR_g47937 [Chara braunii]|eukprot:GBG88467.1 hypothetical protein CBR_g47937 [Chara braunii]
MAQVLLHVYDVTNSASEKTNNAIRQVNKIMRDTMGIGGIFHGAVEVHGEEWSFGYCERGSGVYCCAPKRNPMYTFRETVVLGMTPLDKRKVREIVERMGYEWQGRTYDLLAKNCNHFCEAFCQMLGVGPIPGWVNRFAHAGDTAVEVTTSTLNHLRQVRQDVNVAARQAYRFVFGGLVTGGNSTAGGSGVSGFSSVRETGSSSQSTHQRDDGGGSRGPNHQIKDSPLARQWFSLFRFGSPVRDSDQRR